MDRSTSVWSSIEVIMPSQDVEIESAEAIESETDVSTSVIYTLMDPLTLSVPSHNIQNAEAIQPDDMSTSVICSLIESPQASSVPSPDKKVKCGKSGSSTPRTPRSRKNTPKTSPRKRLVQQGDGSPSSKRRLLFSSRLEDLPEVPRTEKPLRAPNKKRVAKPSKSSSARPSIDLTAPSAGIDPSGYRDESPCQSIQFDEFPSPEIIIKSGESASSTPRTPRGNTPSKTPTKKRLEFTSLSQCQHGETSKVLNYGSEEEIDEVEDPEEGQPVIVIPRTARLFLMNEEEENLPTVNATISLGWPPAAHAAVPSVVYPVSSSAPSSPPLPAPFATPMFNLSSILTNYISTTTPNVIPSTSSSVPSPTAAPTSSPSADPFDTSHLSISPAPSATSPSTLLSIPSSNITPSPHSTVSCNLEKFHFSWRGFPPNQKPSTDRREAFTVTNPGPTRSYTSPYDAFSAIWDTNILNKIAEQTNIYAGQIILRMSEEGLLKNYSRINSWHDTTADELLVYFAIIMAMGTVVKSRIEEYWNRTADIFQTPGFAAAMSIDRFLLIGKCLHFSDNAAFKPNGMSRAEAKLFKIEPIISHLNDKFSKLYIPERNIALDESLTMWKGWLDINQFIRHKAASVGIKTYEVCESQTGYLWRFEVHAGLEPSEADLESPISGKVASLVLRLLNGLEHKGYTVWMDNYYNSPALARELKCRGFDCVGTLRTDRQFVPSELANLSKNDMQVGEVCGCTSGDVDLILWRDKNRVAFISTYHGMATTTCSNTNIRKPSIVPDYNICMGGVDRKDQMIAMYQIERQKNRVWYKKLFRRLLNASILNAFILFKRDHSISHRNFRRSLVEELLTRHRKAKPSRPLARLDSPPAHHHPAQYGFRGNTNHERQRRNCSVCHKRTNTFCSGCDKPMCVFTCFGPYHDKLIK